MKAFMMVTGTIAPLAIALLSQIPTSNMKGGLLRDTYDGVLICTSFGLITYCTSFSLITYCKVILALSQLLSPSKLPLTLSIEYAAQFKGTGQPTVPAGAGSGGGWA